MVSFIEILRVPGRNFSEEPGKGSKRVNLFILKAVNQHCSILIISTRMKFAINVLVTVM